MNKENDYDCFLAYLDDKVRQGTKQKDIAEGAGITAEYLSKIRKRRVTCSVDVQERIAHFFGDGLDGLLKAGQHFILGIDATTESDRQAFSETALLKKVRDRFESLKDQSDLAEAARSEIQTIANDYLGILEAMSCGVTTVDKEGFVAFQNHNAARQMGDLVGRQVDLFLADVYPDYDPDESIVREVFATRKVVTKRDRILGKDYTLRFFPILGTSGRVKRVGVSTIPSRTKEARSRAGAFMESLEAGYMILGKDKEVVTCNNLFRELTGLNQKRISFDDIQFTASRMKNGGDIISHFYKVFDIAQEKTGQCIPSDDGIPLYYKLTPLFDEDQGFVGAICKITLSPQGQARD